jgi:transcriptional regulator with XRE-family HTH domain
MKSARPLWHLKQWRKHRHYTQERLAEMVGMAAGYLSDLEKGKRRFNQDHLELFAEALNCSPGDLINVDPTKEDAFWSVWERVPATERKHALTVLETFTKKTGTDN